MWTHFWASHSLLEFRRKGKCLGADLPWVLKGPKSAELNRVKRILRKSSFSHFSSWENDFPVVKSGFWGHSEKKVLLVSENDLFLTLGLGTFSAWNENLRSLLNTNISLNNGKYGIRNHFWPLESRFFMRKSEKKGPNGLIYIFWNPFLFIFLWTKIKKITMVD